MVFTHSPILSNLMLGGNAEELDEPHELQFSALKITSVRPVQSLKAETPIEVTELGIVIDVGPVQPLKA